MEFTAAWLFPSLIIFNFFFFEELKLVIPRDFLQYFIIFSLIQAAAEVWYDVFLNNAIECRTGRLISEKVADLKRVFDNRKARWSLSDKT